jgi:hypothetical protein
VSVDKRTFSPTRRIDDNLDVGHWLCSFDRATNRAGSERTARSLRAATVRRSQRIKISRG